MIRDREQWGSHIGFIFACIGSAVGLGNIWRFPYIVGTNGGGAFLVPYVIITIGFGLTFMVLEFAVGRYYQTSVISSLINIGRKFKWPGVLIVCVSFGILSYYLVVLGWILSFIVFMTSGISTDFEEYTNSMYPLLSFVAVLGFSYTIIRRGISGGIEKLNKVGIVLLIALLIPLAVYGILLPNSDKGLEFYLQPDFSKLAEPSLWSTAFGQVFFSLSLGVGILLTYGSYLRGKKSLLKSSATIVVANATVSFIAGLMIFSMIFSVGMEPDIGASLVFQVMPSIFSAMQYGAIIGIAFFVLLLVVGLTSAVSLFQVPVSALEDVTHYSKTKSSTIIAILLFIVGSVSALSYSSVNLELFSMPILDLMDTYFGTYGLSISAVVFIVVVTWFMDRKKILEQINLYSRIKMSSAVITIVKFVFPALVITSILFTFFS